MGHKNYLWAGYLLGAMMSSAAVSLRQDYYGMEGYILQVREHWVTAAITGPVAVVMVAVSILGMAALLGMARK